MIRQLKQNETNNSNNNLLSEPFIMKNIIKNHSSTARGHKQMKTTAVLKGQLTTDPLFTVL